MRSSVIITALCAGLTIASPIVKKALVTDIISETVYVYVTEGAESIAAAATTTPANSPIIAAQITTTSVVVDPVTSTPVVVVEPTTTPVAIIQPTTPVVAIASSTPVAAATSSVAAPAATTPDLATPTDYASTVVYHHNIHRRNHSSPDVINDANLASYAATVAASCKFAHDLTPGGGGYGQNIASYGSSGDVQALGASNRAASAITDMWYNDERAAYLDSYFGQANPDFTNFEAWGHFTQVVWKSTTTIGCATQYCSAGTLFPKVAGWFTVCNYKAAGNVDGGYGANVFRGLGQPDVTV